MTKYRIVSDGIRYRVQAYKKGWFLFPPRWIFCGISHPELGFVIRDYDSFKEAQQVLLYNQKEDRAREHGYQPIMQNSIAKAEE